MSYTSVTELVAQHPNLAEYVQSLEKRNADLLVALEEFGWHYRGQERYEAAIAEHEFRECVRKGTKAWAGVPDDFIDELRGGDSDK